MGIGWKFFRGFRDALRGVDPYLFEMIIWLSLWTLQILWRGFTAGTFQVVSNFFFCIRFFQKMLWTRFFLFFFFFFFSFFICFWIVVLYFGLVFRILCHWRTHWVSTSGAVRTSLVERTLNCRITLVGFNDGLCHYDYFFLLPVLTHSFLFIFFLGFRITIALCMLHNGTLVWISIIHFLKSDNVFRDVSFLGVGIRTVNWFFFDTSSVICSFFWSSFRLLCDNSLTVLYSRRFMGQRLFFFKKLTIIGEYLRRYFLWGIQWKHFWFFMILSSHLCRYFSTMNIFIYKFSV